MTVLDDATRTIVTAQFIYQMFVKPNITANMDTAALRAALNAADDWADANATSYNNALPTTFKNTATAQQKALLLAMVLLSRAGALPERSLF